MPIYELTIDNIRAIDETTFAAAGISERGDLQRLLRDRIEVISPDTLVIAEEFGHWEDSKRRIDLLGVDKDANLVVIELKRTEDGGHMELQAIRYAAMVSAMTFENVVEVFEKYLRKLGKEDDARSTLLEFLEWGEPDEDQFAQDVHLVLASAEFSRELTTAVMWLNERDVNITCMRLKPYRDGERLLLDVQQIIPLPEAEEYRVRLREKHEKQRDARRSKRDFTKYDVTIEEETFEQLSKRQAIFTVVKHLCDFGVTPKKIAEQMPWRKSHVFREVPGEVDAEQFLRLCQSQEKTFDPSRFYCSDEELIRSHGSTFAFSNQWGTRTYSAIKNLIEAFPEANVCCAPHGKQKWTEATFLAEVERKLGASSSRLAQQILTWIAPKVTTIWWGEGATSASFVAIHRVEGEKFHLFRLADNGKIGVWVHSLKEKPPFKGDGGKELLVRLNMIPNLHFPPAAINGRARFDLEQLSDPATMKGFREVCDWMIKRIEREECA